jgi:hypothetical protein
MTTADDPCSVCGEPAEEAASALCDVCDRRFHLNQRNDIDGKDCGDVWIDEQYLSLRFACFNCLGLSTAAGEPPVGNRH